jgi:hypothetical protein
MSKAFRQQLLQRNAITHFYASAEAFFEDEQCWEEIDTNAPLAKVVICEESFEIRSTKLVLSAWPVKPKAQAGDVSVATENTQRLELTYVVNETIETRIPVCVVRERSKTDAEEELIIYEKMHSFSSRAIAKLLLAPSFQPITYESLHHQGLDAQSEFYTGSPWGGFESKQAVNLKVSIKSLSAVLHIKEKIDCD